MNAVYLDYSASAPLKPAARLAMIEAMDGVGNASSVHQFGRKARQQVDNARASLAGALGVKPEQVVFTCGATEANNMAMQGLAGRQLIVSSIEHPSILQAAPQAAQIRVDENGIINLNQLEELLKASPSPALVSVMLVNNETGVIQPVEEVVKLARNYGALVHCDAVQALGRLEVDFTTLGVDMLSLSAHKIGGPQGVGALIVREKLGLASLLKGGGQEMRRRAGTENVAGVAGFSASIGTLADDLARAQEWAGWRDEMESTILTQAPDAVIIGQKAPRVATISAIAMPGVKSETQLMAFDLAGYAVSSGSACSSGKVQASHVLKAMGLRDEIATATTRISFGWGSVRQELTGFAGSWLAFYQKHHARKAA